MTEECVLCEMLKMDGRENRGAPEEKAASRVDALREKITVDASTGISNLRDASASQIAGAAAKSTANVVLKTVVLRGRIAAGIAARLGLPALGMSPILSIPVVGFVLTVIVLVGKIVARVVLKIAMPGMSAVSVVRRLVARQKDARRNRKRRGTSR